MKLLRMSLALLSLGFLGSIIWAAMNASMGESFRAMTSDPWGVVALLDLYLGFIIFAIFIFMTTSWQKGLIWTVLLMGLGNVVAGAYLFFWLKGAKRVVIQKEQEAR